MELSIFKFRAATCTTTGTTRPVNLLRSTAAVFPTGTLSYWPYYMSNHLEEAEPLRETVWEIRDNLALNAAPYQSDSYAIGRVTSPVGRSPVGGEVGNLPWTMHNLWMHYRSTMDDNYLKEQLFPLMKGSFNYLNHIVIKQQDGKWSLPKTVSPEYTLSGAKVSWGEKKPLN